MNVAQFLVKCLENEGVRFVFGLPGEENVHLIDALDGSSIRFILVRHEQAASFMADICGRLTGQAGVCLSTLGPGAINLLLGTADATTDSAPLVAISAQGELSRIHKESHQIVDLVRMFSPVTKWAGLVESPEAVPEIVRSAFKLAQTERPGSVYLALPKDIETAPMPDGHRPLKVNVVRDSSPSPSQIARAVKVLEKAKRPIVLAGHGAARNNASDALMRFSERLNIPVATTFMGKGVFPDGHPNSLGTVGFMTRDYANFGFDQADVIVCVGYDQQEFDPEKINPKGDKQIIHLHRYPALVDAHYEVAVGIEASIPESLDALSQNVKASFALSATDLRIRHLLDEELRRNEKDDSYPLKPQRIVSDIRKAMGERDIVLVDTGAVKMWMARLYPTYLPNTCLVSNGLATMAFALPGAIAAKLAFPERKVLAVAGDGGFLMSSQELETAVREKIPLVVLVWVDGAYGLIKWEMELALGRSSHVEFGNPDFAKLAESYGAKGYTVARAKELLPTLKAALNENGVTVIACAVDYSENKGLTKMLGDLTDSL
jgi:acetolactate synthase I/II/III large subunit